MAAPVHSTQLALAQSVGFPPVLLFTAPAGYRTVITTISAVAGLNVPLTWWNVSIGVTGPRIASASHVNGTTDYTNDLLSGRWTLNPGDEVWFTSDGSSWDVMLSGYLLTLP